MQLQAIIFDFGGVLCFHPTDRQIDELASLCRLPREQFLEIYWSMRADYDRAKVTPEQYWAAFAKAAGQTYTASEVAEMRRRDVEFWLSLDDRMMDWARQVRGAGYRTGLLSNLPIDLGEHLRNGMNFVANFDHHSFSYELGAAKPDAAIYQHAVEGLGVKPSEALFLDDRIENVEGARAAGLNAIQFESPARLRESLEELQRVAGRFVPFGAPPVLFE